MKKVLGAVALAVAGLFAFTGCGEKAGETVKIGAIGPLSGAVAVYGVDCLNGINLAAEEINAAGGINGKKIEIVSEDDEGNPEKSVNAYKKIVTQKKTKLIVGSFPYFWLYYGHYFSGSGSESFDDCSCCYSSCNY